MLCVSRRGWRRLSMSEFIGKTPRHQDLTGLTEQESILSTYK